MSMCLEIKTMPEIYDDVDEQNEGVETQNDDKNGDSKQRRL